MIENAHFKKSTIDDFDSGNLNNLNKHNEGRLLNDKEDSKPSQGYDDTDPVFEEKFDQFLATDNKTKEIYFNFFVKFSWMHFKKFFPVSIVYCIYIMINVINILFVSHSEFSKTNKELLYAVNLGLSLYYMLGISICFGLSSSLDTFCTNSYGAKLYYLMGCYRNRALVIFTIIYIPTALFLFFLKDVLAGLGQDEQVAIHAGNFLRGMLPGMLFFYWGDVNRRFLLAQGVFIPPIFLVFITSLLHPIWVYLYFNVFEMGAFGNGLACSTTNIINYVLLIFLLKRYSIKEAYFFINKDAFIGWKEFFSLALPSMLMVCLETWNYQIINFMVGYLGDYVQENTNSYLISFSSIIYMFPFGLAVSASTIVGRLVGDFATKKSEIATKMIIVFSLLFSFFIVCLLLIFKNYAPYIYTSNEDEITLMQTLLWIYLWYAFMDIFINSYAGIYRGLGMQKIIAFTNFICYYLISLPLAYLLTFAAGWGIYGVWTSYVVGITTMVITYGIIHFKRVNYYRICKEANKRLSRDSFIISANSTNNSMEDNDGISLYNSTAIINTGEIN